ncbi:hypothetical protein N7495_003111 [Penicillium taxi]|uniref:uncharacterized protein n=1 Tax=Penicillium taxi TaxID=168475 RepID=UPI0025452D64|nr:uncharacterized protein N7495_003111 [Penicillium taxi]KAJ5902583.1 hypothetical protein N7495_003111 [Penicillium taxi]
MSPASEQSSHSLWIHTYYNTDVVRSQVMVAFAAIALYNAVELVALCFLSFKRRRGSYFWSLLISSASIFPHCLGFIMLFFTGTSPYFCVTLIALSWCAMITGQSIVLWSRLHLLLQNTKVLWGLLWMIIINAILFHTPTIALLYGTIAAPESHFARGYAVMERIQLVVFCIQELVISGIYVWQVLKLLRLRPEGTRHDVLHQVLIINMIILLLDVSVVLIEYVGFYTVQVMLKPVAYSIKLKLEYAILGKLVIIARGSPNGDEVPSSMHEIDSCHSLREEPSLTEQCANFYRQYSPPWFWENPQHSSYDSSPM